MYYIAVFIPGSCVYFFVSPFADSKDKWWPWCKLLRLTLPQKKGKVGEEASASDFRKVTIRPTVTFPNKSFLSASKPILYAPQIMSERIPFLFFS